jgi:hypothetical protein
LSFLLAICGNTEISQTETCIKGAAGGVTLLELRRSEKQRGKNKKQSAGCQRKQMSGQPLHKQDNHHNADGRTGGYAHYGHELVFVEGTEVHVSILIWKLVLGNAEVSIARQDANYIRFTLPLKQITPRIFIVAERCPLKWHRRKMLNHQMLTKLSTGLPTALITVIVRNF